MSLVRLGVSVPQQLVEAFDRRIRRKGYGTRSEAIRDIIQTSSSKVSGRDIPGPWLAPSRWCTAMARESRCRRSPIA